MSIQHHIDVASKMLRENNAIGMSARNEPIHWNLHQAICSLVDGLEEAKKENETLSQRVRQLEMQLHNMR